MKSVIPRYPVGDVEVSEVTFEDAIRLVLDARGRDDGLSVHFVTAHTVVEGSRDPQLIEALEAADLVAADGMPLMWVGRLRGRQVSRVCGPDFMPELIGRGRESGARHFLYGGAPGVPERLADRFRSMFPGAEIVGTYSPPFRPLGDTPDEDEIRRINRAQPDFVWVGLGSPKQDLWIAQHRPMLAASALLAVGAAFDIHAGDVRRAPRWMQRSGLEWTFRLAMEPRRLLWRYTVVNAKFIGIVVRQMLRDRARGRDT